ncbi:hypothetical protein [Cypionkella psychrotolerans]|uniref:hypothetical protein n=1 Tax=Cypionkella psychrotolerans TaxID=1678131 RepID=UPI0012E2287A|nr:hypothetical protein [Cypionkella psychrotolerans]
MADNADLSMLGDIVRNGLIPKRVRMSQALQRTLREKAVHCLSLFRSESNDTSPKAAIAWTEDALALHPALIMLLSDPMFVPRHLCEVLPEPIRVPSLSREVIVFALTKSHS